MHQISAHRTGEGEQPNKEQAMKCACGSGLWTTIGAVVGLVAVGYGGYNLLTTGCPLGSCRDSGGAAVVPAAATSEKATDSCHAAGEACSKGETCDKSEDCAKTEACTKEGDEAKCPFESAGEAACPHATEAGTQAKAPTKG